MFEKFGLFFNQNSDDFREIMEFLESLKKCDNSRQQIEQYSKYLIKSQNLLENIVKTNKKFDTGIMCDKFLSFPIFYSESLENTSNLLKVLANSQKIHYHNFTTNLTTLFTKCYGFALQEKFILNLANDFFEPLMSNPNFSFNMFENQMPQHFFINFIPDKDIVKWGLNLLVDKPDPFSYQNVNVSLLFSSFKNALELAPEFSDELLLSFAKLFNKLSRCNTSYSFNHSVNYSVNYSFNISNITQLFINCGLMDLISEKISEEKWQEALIYLLTSYNIDSAPPNSGVLSFLDKLCRENNEKQSQVLSLFRIMKCFDRIDQKFPLESFFTKYQQPIPDLIELINDSIDYPKLLPKMFRNLFILIFSQMEDDISIYIQIIELIMKSKIDFSEKSRKFLRAMIVTPSASTTSLILNNSWFANYFLKMISSPNSKEIQPLVFHSLLEVMTTTHSHRETCAHFLKIAPTKGNMHCLMDYIENNQNIECFTILLSAFIDSIDISEKFVECEGLEFIEKCYQNGLLQIDLYSMILGSLVAFRQFEEIDKFIIRLPKDHLLFQISQKQMEMIVFGMNSAKYRPMRVPSLFHYLETKSNVDTYNSYILGRFAIKQFLKQGYDIFEIPFITEISNRYLQPKHVELMMKNPKNLDRFCDYENFDHFSLFQIYPSQNELSFHSIYKAISFWVRFDQISNESHPSFFNTDGISMIIKDGYLITNIESKEYKTPIANIFPEKQNLKWYHFFIYLENKRNVNAVIIVNNKLRFISKIDTVLNKNNKNSFTFAKFKNNGDQLMFIGTTIRFFSQPQNFDEYSSKIFIHGPNFITPISDEYIITPFNLQKKIKAIVKEIPPSLYAVPYLGFPFHFISFRRLSDLFNILNESQTNEQFKSVFDALLAINKIVETNTDRFYRKLLNSFKISRKFITKEIFLKALRSVSGQRPSDHVLSMILFDHEMWEMVDVKILLEVLFDDYFKSINWAKIQDFELFLTTIVRKHPNEQSIVEILLKNINKLPNLNKHLMNTLNYRKKHLAVQMMIIDSYIRQLPVTNEITCKKLYEQAKDIILISAKPLAVKLFYLMTKIAVTFKDSTIMSNSLIYIVFQLSSFPVVWSNVFELVHTFGTPFICLLLALVWSRTYAEVFTYSFNNSSLETVECEYFTALEMLQQRVNELLNDRTCLMLLLNFYPILLNITGFQTSIYKTDFLNNLANSVLEDYSIKKPKHMEYKIDATIQFIYNSQITPFYFFILKKSSPRLFKPLFMALLVGYPFDNDELYSIYLPQFYIKFLCDFSTFPCENLFLQYLLFPICQNYFTFDQQCNIISLIFSICENNYKNHEIANIILLAMYNSYLQFNQNQSQNQDPIDDPNIDNHQELLRKKIFAILEENWFTLAKIMNTSKSELTWFYIIKNESEHLVEKFKEIEWSLIIKMNTQKESYELHYKNSIQNVIHEANRVIYEFTSYKFNFLSEIESFSREVNKFLSESQMKSEMKRSIFQDEKNLLTSSFSVIEEKIQWSLFMSTLHDQFSDVNQFEPKAYHLAPKCFPYKCPQRFTPSPFYPNSPEIMTLFNKYTSQNRLNVTSVKLFLKSASAKGNVIKIVNCKLSRYSIDIPSVMFIYPDEILFLTYAELVNSDTIRLLGKINPYFVESVFLGHWGSTSIFASHIVIKTLSSHMIFAIMNHKKAFKIWSFKQGHFLVKMESKKLIQVSHDLTTMTRKAIRMLPSYSFLFEFQDISQVHSKWLKNEISTDDFLLVANGLCGKLFISLNDYPYFPFNFKRKLQAKIENEKSKNVKETATFLHRALPFSYFALTNRNHFLNFNLSLNSTKSSYSSSKEFLDSNLNVSFIEDEEISSSTEESEKNIAMSNINLSRFILDDNQTSTHKLFNSTRQKSSEEFNLHLSDLNTNNNSDSAHCNSGLTLNSLNSHHKLNRFNSINAFENDELTKNIDKSQFYLTSISQNQHINNQNNEHIIISINSKDNLKENLHEQDLPLRMRRYSDAVQNEISTTLLGSYNKRHHQLNDQSNNNSKHQQMKLGRFNSSTDLTESLTIEKANRIIEFYSKSKNKKSDSNYMNFDDINDEVLCVPANFYYSPMFNTNDYPFECVRKHRDSLEKLGNATFVLNWIRHNLVSDIPRKIPNKPFKENHICHIDYQHVCQPLRKSLKPQRTLVFWGNRIRRMKRLTCHLNGSLFVVIDRKSLTASVLEMPSEKTTALIYDRFFAYTKSINVSGNGIFMCADFAFGMTRIYRVIYNTTNRKTVSSFELISDFSWKYSPISQIDGIHWICATAAYDQLVLWEIYGGTIHRVINLHNKINSLSVDEEYGVWTATDTKIYFISFNGSIIAETELIQQKLSSSSLNNITNDIKNSNKYNNNRNKDNKLDINSKTKKKSNNVGDNEYVENENEITQIEALQLHSSNSQRAAVCGTSHGNVYLLTPRFDTKTIDCKELKGGRQSEIVKIIFHPNKKCFVTVDDRFDCIRWTASKLGGDPLQMKLFDTCALCSHEPTVQCESCNRAICKSCCINGLCLFCSVNEM
ncbi:hypothetical protein TRFO_41662 [Tritrichomonas foetus]|uniref:BEACH domain-containing protein n=1 Tax=Tritrichomonas foetus TaxID=1144522 RepID=A0A1J4L3Z2_9EUKA|nr:hypothetical protein TRFO_41662 [Tritrichomonas foetus]|eukprot:OHT16670.1 hypothetical protein TRFO_41662 [Tritrichomonas foetus]